MKKLISILPFLLFGSVTANSQTFVATPNDSIEGTYNVADWASDYIYLENNTGAPLALSFLTISNTMTPAGWNVVLCTNNTCYPYVPANGSMGTIADGDSAMLHVQCGFMGIAGTNQIRVRVFETGNPSNADTITFLYHAQSAIGIDESVSGGWVSQNFPNPFTESTTISYNLPGENGTMVVSDATGKVVAEYFLGTASGQITIENLIPGSYFYAVYSNEALISRRIMIVQ